MRVEQLQTVLRWLDDCQSRLLPDANPDDEKAPSPSPVAWQARLWRSSGHLLAVPLLLLLALPIVAMLLRISPADLLGKPAPYPGDQRCKFEPADFADHHSGHLGTGYAGGVSVGATTFSLSLPPDTLIDLPTVLPPAVAGVVLLMAFGRRGLFGPWLEQFGITLPFTTVAVVMAQTFVASSFYVKAAALGFAAIDPELKQAAARWRRACAGFSPHHTAVVVGSTVKRQCDDLGACFGRIWRHHHLCG